MEPLPRTLSRLAGLAVVACAAIGLLLGAGRGYGEASASSIAAGESGEHVDSAKAIAPPPSPVLDEAAVRRIAHDEAQSLMAKAPAAPSAPTRRRASASSTTEFASPSDAGIVYARPPRGSDSPSTAPPLGGAPPPPGQVEQF